MNIKTRCVSMLLAAMMLFSMLPAAVSAADSAALTAGEKGIDYTAGDVIVKAKTGGRENEKYFINLTKETFVVPSDYIVAAYSLNGGTSWTAVGSKSVFDSAALAKLFTATKDVTLAFTDKYNSKTRKPADGAIVVNFPRINRRPALKTYTVNYKIGADDTGATTGAWVLTEKGGKTSVKEGIEIALSDSAGKGPNDKGFGRFTGKNGSADGIGIVPLQNGGKTAQTAYFIRQAPKANGDGTFTAASIPRKITVQGQRKPQAYKADKNKKTISYGANTIVLKAEDNIITESGLQSSGGSVYVAGEENGTVLLMMSPASESAPASAMMMFSVEKSAPVAQEGPVLMLSDVGIMAAPPVNNGGVVIQGEDDEYTLTVGETLILTASVTDPGASGFPVLVWNSTNPNVASVSSNGLISAVVTALTVGETIISVTAIGGGYSSVKVIVTSSYVPPRITTLSPLPGAELGIPYNYRISATGTAPITWKIENQPAGLGFTINSNGDLAGTPPTSFAPGTYNITISASNQTGPAGSPVINTDERTFTFSITAPKPKFVVTYYPKSGDGSLTATVDGLPVNSGSEVTQGKTVLFTATPSADYRVFGWTDTERIDASDNPDGVVYNSGTEKNQYKGRSYAVSVGNKNITVTVDFEPAPDYTVEFWVKEGNGTLTSKSIIANNTIKQRYTAKENETVTFTAAPGTDWKVKNWSAIVNGVEMAGTTTAGLTNLSIPLPAITDPALITSPAVPYTVAVCVEFEMIPLGDPVINTYILADGKVGASYNQTLQGTPASRLTWAVVRVKNDTDAAAVIDANGYVVLGNAGLPPGLSLNAATGVISGQPQSPDPNLGSETYKFIIRAYNGGDAATKENYAYRELSIWVDQRYTVRYANPAKGGGLTATAANNTQVFESEELVFTATAEYGFEIDYWTIKATGNPEGNTYYISADGSLKELSGTTVPAGSYTYNTFTLTKDVLSELHSKSNTANRTIITVAVVLKTTTFYTIYYDVIGSGGGIIESMTANGSPVYGDGKTGISVPGGNKIVITAKPDSGYVVKEWKMSASTTKPPAALEVVGNGLTYQITSLTGENKYIYITVEFTSTQQTQRVYYKTSGVGGSISALANGTAVNSGSWVIRGSQIVFTAAARPGYRVNGWHEVTQAEWDSANPVLNASNLIPGQSGNSVLSRTLGADMRIIVTFEPIYNVTAFSLNKNSTTIMGRGSEQLIPILTPSETPVEVVQWEVTNSKYANGAAAANEESVITVKDGLITGVSVGTATVTAKVPVAVSVDAGGYLIRKCEITVIPIPVTDITGVPATAIVNLPLSLTGVISPITALLENQPPNFPVLIEWSIPKRLDASGNITASDILNTAGASITNNMLTATKAGSVTIRATIKSFAANGDQTGAVHFTKDFTITASVFVPVTNITNVPAPITAKTPVELTGTVSPSNASNKTITWSVISSETTTGSGTAIADGNVLTAGNEGNVRVRATIADGLAIGKAYTKDFDIKVNPVTSTGITLNRSTVHLLLGNAASGTFKLEATVISSQTANPSMIWTSSSPDVAAVDSTGKVVANGLGTATITVKTSDGTNKSATCVITVTSEAVKPTIITGTLAKGSQGTSYKAALTASGTVPVIWEEVISAGAAGKLPGGLTLSPAGVISGIPDTAGNFTFTVKAKNIAGEETKSFTIEISQPVRVSGISLHADATIISINNSAAVRVTIFPSDAANKEVTWSTTNAGIAEVDGSGRITGISPGSATITATTADGGYTASCTVSVIRPPTEGVTLNKNSTSLPVGSSESLIATVYPSTAADKTITWSTSSSSIATVTNGAVVAVAAGTATITAKTVDGYTASCVVTVTISVTGVTLNKTSLTLLPENKETIAANIAPTNATNKEVNWSTSDKTVATVDSAGLVTAVAPGKANITATAADGGKTASCAVTVNPIAVTGITINKNSARIAVNDTETLTVTIAPANATNKNTTWNSSNTNAATVDNNGRVTGRAEGTATISAVTSDGAFTASCAITVHTVAVAGVTMKTSATVGIGGSETLTPTVIPANATNKSVTWASSNTSVALIDSNGRVTGRAEGTANITAVTADGTFTATCVVKVSPNTPVSGVSLNKTSMTLTQGASEKLTASVTPSGATNKSVSWTSSNADVASVDNAGTVTARSAGTALITVKTADGGKTASCTLTVDGIFNITLNQAANGTARVSVTQARPGNTVTLFASVNDGYYVSWRITPANVIVTENSFIMPASDVTVTPVYQRIPLIFEFTDPNAINASSASRYDLNINNNVSIPASVLSGLRGRNPDFEINVKTGYSSYQVPVDFASIIPGYNDILSKNNLKESGVTFNIFSEDKTSDRAVNEKFAQDMPYSRLLGAVGFGVEIALLKDGVAGQAVSLVKNFTERVTRLIPMPSYMTSIPDNWGVFRYNETSGRFEFVPHTAEIIGGVVYAVVYSTMNGLYVVAENTIVFSDVNPGEWYTNYIEKAASKRLVQGIGQNQYDPERNVTRAEFVQMTVNALQLPGFAVNTKSYGDVSPGEWYYDAIMKARSEGLLEKFTGNNFYPGQAITREEMAAILAAAARREKLTSNAPQANLSQMFSDYGQINQNYAADIELVYRLGIMQGVGNGMFSPKGTTTRAQAATVQIRLLELLRFVG